MTTAHLVSMDFDDDQALFAGLEDIVLPDPRESAAILAKLVRKREEEKAAELRRERQRKKNAAEAEAVAREDHGAEAMARMAELHEKLGLDSALQEEFQETQQALFPVAQPAGLPTAVAAAAAAAPDYMEGVNSALVALGLDASFLPASPYGPADEGGSAALLEEGVRCGFVANQALRQGVAPAPTVDSLFLLLSRSPDMEVAGAAFVALLSLLNDPSLPKLMLDAAYGLPSANSPIYSALPRPCRVDSIPSIRSLYEALLANGYCPTPQGAGAGASGARRSGPSPAKQQRQRQQGEGSGGGGEEEGASLRIQAVKLTLQTAAAVCRYCQQHPQLRGTTLDRDALCDLVLAAAQLWLDPCERLLLDDLDDVMALALEAFEESDWQRKLPQLAERLGERAHSNLAHLRILKRLPATSPRGLALQQLSGAALLVKIIPAGKGAEASGHSAARRRDGALDPTALITAQSWFDNPKGLVTNAAVGGQGSVPRGGYHVAQVELLLRTANLLLWPHMLRYSEGAGDTPITPAFLQRWCGTGTGFLDRVGKAVKSAGLEEQSLRATASLMAMDYKALEEARKEAMAE